MISSEFLLVGDTVIGKERLKLSCSFSIISLITIKHSMVEYTAVLTETQ